MSLIPEPRTCPRCGAIFYLTATDAEIPAHGCRGSSSTSPEPPAAEANPSEASAEQPGGATSSSQDGAPLEATSPPAPGASRGELREETARSLRERGYVLAEDAHGLRITGSPGGVPSRSNLSPSDIVRMAAELDGGVKHAGTLQTCPKCQARTAAGEPKCQWCGEPFPPATAPG
jgi:hypothetical protein